MRTLGRVVVLLCLGLSLAVAGRSVGAGGVEAAAVHATGTACAAPPSGHGVSTSSPNRQQGPQ